MNATVRTWGAVALALVVFATMAYATSETPSWGEEPAGLGGEDAQMGPLVESLFDTHVFSLEVLGVLLTAAMIGALVIARPLGQAPDESHYESDPHIDEARRPGSPTTAAPAPAATGDMPPAAPSHPAPGVPTTGAADAGTAGTAGPAATAPTTAPRPAATRADAHPEAGA